MYCFARREMIDDERGDEHFYPEHEQVDRVAFYLEIYGPFIKIRNQQKDRHCAKHNGSNDANRSSEDVSERQYKCQSSDKQGKEYQKGQ